MQNEIKHEPSILEKKSLAILELLSGLRLNDAIKVLDMAKAYANSKAMI